MSSIDWRDLRSLNGSQNNAFEELCCQLAAHEKPEGSTFIRKGTPDAGVECYAILNDETEWGWQAKYFLSVGDSQWGQIDDSVKTALEKHPKLVKYTICLPIDRPDARIEGRESLLDKWQKRVEKWTGWAAGAGMDVQFDYWGSHEILDRLSREEHRGRFFFWFGKDFLSQSWFEDRLQESIEVAGPRYTPEIHIALPIAQHFDSLTRTERFFVRIKHRLRDVRKDYSYSAYCFQNRGVEFETMATALDSHLQGLYETLLNLDNLITEPIPWPTVTEQTNQALQVANSYLSKLEELKRQAREIERGKNKEDEATSSTTGWDHQFCIDLMHQLIRRLRELLEFSEGLDAKLSNSPAMLLIGEAGQGKTHLFCDIAKGRIANGLPTILLMGQRFMMDEPWTQIIRQLGFPETCARDDLLGALQAVAEVKNSKALIMIDALNEGDGKTIWSSHLPAMLQALERYPWIDIAISVRSSYERAIIPDGREENKIVRIEHPGFAEHEYQATRTFFDYYSIELPTVPLLIPEFQNPLFLKLLCKGLSDGNQSKFPKGLQGITVVFRLFIDSVNEKLSDVDYCDFNPSRRIVRQAIDSLAELIADQQTDWLPIEVAERAVDQVLPGRSYDNSLYRHLVSEGILLVDNHYLSESKWIEGVQFAHEKFSDHIVVKHLLDKYLDVTNPEQSFLPEQPLAFVLDKGWRSEGLVEALCVQIPELIGVEIFDVAPTIADSYSAVRGFLQSLVWRNPRDITDETTAHLSRISAGNMDQVLNSLLTVATSPDHPYNADFLHARLMKDRMAERDAWWSILLHHQYGKQNAVDRLVDWAWAPEDKSHIDDEAVRLCGVALGWFLTTSNRFLRDRSTKALVNLFTQKIQVLVNVMEQFLDVDDPYVSERLYAVAYGCALRSFDNDQIAVLAQRVYEWVLEGGNPPVHILLRDYARGVIEYALSRGIELDIDVARIRPPYSSDWPQIPSESEIEKYKFKGWRRDEGEEDGMQSHLYYSILGGDFARYVVGTNIGSSKWLTVRLDESKGQSPEEKLILFEQSISEPQRSQWENLSNLCEQLKELKQQVFLGGLQSLFDSLEEDDEIQDREENQDENENIIADLEQKIAGAKDNFQPILTSEQQIAFDDFFPFLVGTISNEPPRLDLSLCLRWMVYKVFDLGWNPERFGEFDEYVNRCDYRRANKPERIGKKYQWLAYHEFLARVADNFIIRDDISNHPEGNQYIGPWQLSIRDIDPSCVLRTTGRGSSWRETVTSWWFPTEYEDWKLEADAADWMKIASDLPNIKSIIDVTRPDDDSSWLALGGFYHWEQPIPAEKDRSGLVRREIWLSIKAYLVHEKDCDGLLDWAVEQNYMGRWMPYGTEIYRVFVGELFWSPAYNYHTDPYEGTTSWQRGGPKRKAPKPILPVVDIYVQEDEGYDCSIDDSISISLPTKQIVEEMNLSWNGSEGRFFNNAGKLVAYDPSVEENGPKTLLFHRDTFLSFLREHGYCVVWTVLGSKELIGGGLGHKDWKGRLEINGAYCLRDGQIEGKITPHFQEP